MFYKGGLYKTLYVPQIFELKASVDIQFQEQAKSRHYENVKKQGNQEKESLNFLAHLKLLPSDLQGSF